MCRNIRTLYHLSPPATQDEVRDASIQFVRKLAGFTRPSHANETAFDLAVDEISSAAGRLIASLHSSSPPRDRAQLAERAKARSAKRFAAK